MNELLKTVLYDEHIKLGAKMAPFAGFEMPIQYQNISQEILAVRNNVGMFDVSHMGEFLILGKDACKFVDYLLPNNIQLASPNKAIYSPLLNENGTIIDDLIVYKINNEEIFICVNASNIEKDFQHISQMIKSFDCEIKNMSSDYSLIALQGPNSFETLKFIPEFSSLQDIGYYDFQMIGEGAVPLIVARTGYTGEDGFEIFGPHSFIKSLWAKLIAKKVEPCGLAARDTLRIEVGYPLYGHELSEEYSPLESNLSFATKLNKNDFIGKTALLSKPKHSQLYFLKCEKGIPRENYKIYQNEIEIGFVTSGTMSPVLKEGIAIARVFSHQYQEGQEIFVKIRDKFYKATIQKKPFITGGHK